MKSRLSTSTAFLPPIVLAAILGGCATEPIRPVKRSAIAAPAPVAVNPTPVQPAAPVPTAPPPVIFTLDPEVTVLVQRLTEGGGDSHALAHDLVGTTGFPEALASLAPGAQAPKTEPVDSSRSTPPARGLTADGNSTELIDHDWTGLVLVPIDTAISMAHTTAVRLLKIEAHPLQDGRVRIWIRLQNVHRDEFSAEIACAFQIEGARPPTSPFFYEIDLPGRDYRDVFFVSPVGRLNTYTVLVRPNRFHGFRSE